MSFNSVNNFGQVNAPLPISQLCSYVVNGLHCLLSRCSNGFVERFQPETKDELRLAKKHRVPIDVVSHDFARDAFVGGRTPGGRDKVASVLDLITL